MEPKFWIWSHEHQAWWGPAREGYTPHLERAGRYGLAEAMDICRDANGSIERQSHPEEAMVPVG